MRAQIGDGHGDDDPERMRPTGAGLMKFARIPGSATQVSRDRVPAVSPKQTNAPSGAGLDSRIHDKIGLRVIDAPSGVVDVAKTDYVRNSFGSLNGGVLAIVAEAAALATAGAGFVATDLQLHYLAQTKSGPARTTTSTLRSTAHGRAVEVATVDTGNDDLLLTTATVVLSPPEPA